VWQLSGKGKRESYISVWMFLLNSSVFTWCPPDLSSLSVIFAENRSYSSAEGKRWEHGGQDLRFCFLTKLPASWFLLSYDHLFLVPGTRSTWYF
jgi:hypothetical protein